MRAKDALNISVIYQCVVVSFPHGVGQSLPAIVQGGKNCLCRIAFKNGILINRIQKRGLPAFLAVQHFGIAMKIEGPNKTSQTSTTRSKDKAGGSGISFGDLLTSGTSEAAAPTATRSIAQVDALLAAQEVDDPAARAAKGRMVGRADTLLEQLDAIRMGLLTGTLSVGDVLNVADVVAQHRERIQDPGLSALLDEIDLRAQIEIAKMRKAMDESDAYAG